MLVPICEECYKKQVRSRVGFFPYQAPDMPIKKYLELFQMYLAGCGDIETLRKNILFVHGLSDENKKEAGRLPFIEARLNTEDFIKDIMLYLSEVEHYKDVIFGKKDDKKPEPMDA